MRSDREYMGNLTMLRTNFSRDPAKHKPLSRAQGGGGGGGISGVTTPKLHIKEGGGGNVACNYTVF